MAAASVEIANLLALFPQAHLGELQPVLPQDVPGPYRQLLDHDQHMTVTVEAYHQDLVDVQVLEIQHRETTYGRRILLKRHRDGGVVLFGLVRIQRELLEPTVRAEIEAGKIPLGRVLIQHDVWRRVQRHALFRVHCGPELMQHFSVPLGTLTFGRTAMIYCDEEPAIELLEIVAPIA